MRGGGGGGLQNQDGHMAQWEAQDLLSLITFDEFSNNTGIDDRIPSTNYTVPAAASGLTFKRGERDILTWLRGFRVKIVSF